MSYPYHRNYAVNEQPGHQLYYDQVLQGWSFGDQSFNNSSVANPVYVPGAFTADGGILLYGSNCTVALNDTLYSNGVPCCSTWASAPPYTDNCCPCERM